MKNVRLLAILLYTHGTLTLADGSMPAFKDPIGNPVQTLNLKVVAGSYTCTRASTMELFDKDTYLKNPKSKDSIEFAVTVAEDAVNIEVDSKHNSGEASVTLSLDRNGNPSVKGINAEDATPGQKMTIRAVANLFYPLALSKSNDTIENARRGKGQHRVSYLTFLKALEVPMSKGDPMPNVGSPGPNDSEIFELLNSVNYLQKINSSAQFSCRPVKAYDATFCMDSNLGWRLIAMENGLPINSDILVTHFWEKPRTGMTLLAASRVTEICNRR